MQKSSLLRSAVIVYLSRQEYPRSCTEIARALSVHRESVFRVVKTLVDEGYAYKASKRYGLTETGKNKVRAAQKELLDRVYEVLGQFEYVAKLLWFKAG